MTREVVVGVDVGTTDTKALVVGTDGAELALEAVRTVWRERDGWADTTASALRDGMTAVLDRALDAAAERAGDRVQVLGVGITGIGESGVLLEPDGSVVTPVVAWFDARGADEVQTLPGEVREAFPRTTGLPVSSLCTVAKLLWLRSEGVTPAPGRVWLNVPEYLAHALGGERAAEPSLAARTGLLAVDAVQPWEAALAAVGASPDLLPPLVPAGTSLGQVTGTGPVALRGAHVTVAGHDHPVASFGAGAWGADDLFDSFGTAESVMRVLATPLTPQQRERLVGLGLTFGCHVLEDRWVASGPTRAGLVLRRVLRLLGLDDAEGRDRVDQGWDGGWPSAGVTVAGAAMSDVDVTVATSTDALDPDTVWAAALRHTCEAAATLVHAIDAEVGTPHRSVVAAGGWTRMSSVRAAKAHVMGDVTYSTRQQAGAYGAAVLAAWAASGRQGTAVDVARALGGSAASSSHPPDPGGGRP